MEKIIGVGSFIAAHYIELAGALAAMAAGIFLAMEGYAKFFKVIPGDQGEAKVEAAAVKGRGFVEKVKKFLKLA